MLWQKNNYYLNNTARQSIVQTVNNAMVQAYWHVGRLIVEHKQKGDSKAEYGTQQLAYLAEKLQADFGKHRSSRLKSNPNLFQLIV